MLFNEPKLLKLALSSEIKTVTLGFSALQRAEIAEIGGGVQSTALVIRFSALQRAEIAEIRIERKEDDVL